MRLDEIYQPGVHSVDRDESISEVASRMQYEEISSMAVLEDGRFVGIITERDLARAVADGVDPYEAVAGDYMTEDPVVGTPDMDVHSAADLMLALGVRHLPVVLGGLVVGMVSARDLLAESARGSAEVPVPA